MSEKGKGPEETEGLGGPKYRGTGRSLGRRTKGTEEGKRSRSVRKEHQDFLETPMKPGWTNRSQQRSRVLRIKLVWVFQGNRYIPVYQCPRPLMLHR